MTEGLACMGVCRAAVDRLMVTLVKKHQAVPPLQVRMGISPSMCIPPSLSSADPCPWRVWGGQRLNAEVDLQPMFLEALYAATPGTYDPLGAEVEANSLLQRQEQRVGHCTHPACLLQPLPHHREGPRLMPPLPYLSQDLFLAEVRGRGLMLSLVEKPFDSERHAHVYKKQVRRGTCLILTHCPITIACQWTPNSPRLHVPRNSTSCTRLWPPPTHSSTGTRGTRVCRRARLSACSSRGSGR